MIFYYLWKYKIVNYDFNCLQNERDYTADLVNISLQYGPDDEAVEKLFFEVTRIVLFDLFMALNRGAELKHGQNQLRKLITLASDYASKEVADNIIFASSLIQAYGFYRWGCRMLQNKLFHSNFL